jgi:hypothetical protein
MKNKFDNLIANFKKVWADERGKALIKLGLYILFAVFAVFTATATYRINNADNDKHDNAPVDAMTAYKNLSGYAGSYTIGDNKYTFTSATKQIIKIGDYYYFAEGQNLVNDIDATLEAPTFEFKFWYLTPSFIYDLIENGKESYTTNFSNGSVETSYLVPLDYFASNYDGNVLAIENTSMLDGKNIEIITTKTENKIVKVKINLSTYYVLINDQITNYNVEIDYK